MHRFPKPEKPKIKWSLAEAQRHGDYFQDNMLFSENPAALCEVKFLPPKARKLFV